MKYSIKPTSKFQKDLKRIQKEVMISYPMSCYLTSLTEIITSGNFCGSGFSSTLTSELVCK